MPRTPKGKRTISPDGTTSIGGKNSNGHGSAYYEQPSQRTNGQPIHGRWRATYTDPNGKRRTVSAPTRLKAETKRDTTNPLCF